MTVNLLTMAMILAFNILISIKEKCSNEIDVVFPAPPYTA
jgi:hypothetical protein